MEQGSFRISSPIGDLKVEFSAKGLRSVHLITEGEEDLEVSGLRDEAPFDELAAFKTFVNDLFFCRDAGLSGIELDMANISDFRKSIYIELRKVPFGSVITYGDLARKAHRLGWNPLSSTGRTDTRG